MGFGISFIGYLFTVFDMGNLAENSLSMIITQILTVIGYLILLIGLDRLGRYIKMEVWAKYTFCGMSLAALMNLVVQTLWYTGHASDKLMADIRSVLALLLSLFYAVFHWFFIKGLQNVAEETECISVKGKAKLSFVATSVFSALNVVANLPIAGLEALMAPRYVLFILVTVINAVTLFSAYMWICLPDDVDMEKRSRKKKREDL